MLSRTWKTHRRFLCTSVIAFLIIAILIALPTGYEDALLYQGTIRAVGEVLEVDNDTVKSSGLIQSGEQMCTLLIQDEPLKGREIEGVNFLSGSLEKDKIFVPGDRAYVTISESDGQILSAVITDHYRLTQELWLFAAFALFLVLFAGKNGLQSLYSFAITVLMIWKVLVPAYLKGMNPVWVGMGITVLLTAIIILFVYGFERRTVVATLGSLLGIFTTAVLGILFTDLFKIHGAVMSDSESLLYSGYAHLNLTAIFMSGIFIGAPGEMMDLSADITSAGYEGIKKKPEIVRWEEGRSGLNVGRAAMGTMTTTLLLAYSGGYIALLMVFMAQGTPIDHILNYKYVAAEILDTVVGSFGLVTVAPFTALAAGFLLTRRVQVRQTVPAEQQKAA